VFHRFLNVDNQATPVEPRSNAPNAIDMNARLNLCCGRGHAQGLLSVSVALLMFALGRSFIRCTKSSILCRRSSAEFW
jgi:hypothetical protein